MHNGSKVVAVIAAAGFGTRMGSSVPKQFLKIDGEFIIEKTIKAFADCPEVDEVYVVTGKSYVDFFRETFVEDQGLAVDGIIEGGDTRQGSVLNGIRHIQDCTGDDDIILIHDGARPFVSQEIIENVIDDAYKSGAAIAAVPVKDTIRKGGRTLERSDMYAVQTPQGFRYGLIRNAYQSAIGDGFIGTDDAGVAEYAGHSVAITEGSYENIKITTKEDMPVKIRVGTGYDVHALTEGRKLILGGVDIPFERGLMGHSDADVLVHAVMDALLGAAALGDIGRHFPDSDPKYKGISSIELLKHVGGLLEASGYKVGNIDATLIAQRPKILPYIETMKKNISEALDLDISQVNIKGTTTEKLGFTGREEGIAAEAICLING